jgi:hypothetical protein
MRLIRGTVLGKMTFTVKVDNPAKVKAKLAKVGGFSINDNPASSTLSIADNRKFHAQRQGSIGQFWTFFARPLRAILKARVGKPSLPEDGHSLLQHFLSTKVLRARHVAHYPITN